MNKKYRNSYAIKTNVHLFLVGVTDLCQNTAGDGETEEDEEERDTSEDDDEMSDPPENLSTLLQRADIELGGGTNSTPTIVPQPTGTLKNIPVPNISF